MDLPIRPIRRFVLLLDDPDETVVCGVVVKTGIWRTNMDYYVVRVGTEEKVDFGQGDRVILSSPNVGRKVRLCGCPFRLVRVEDVIAVVQTLL